MWIQFSIAFIVGVLVIFLPGSLLFKALRFGTVSAIICAPIGSISTYIVLTTLYGFLSIPCNVGSLFVTSILVFGIIFVGSYLARKKTAQKKNVLFALSKKETLILSGYIVVGIALCLYFFIKSLDGATSFYNRVDNTTHLSLISTFSQSGLWSSLYTSSYLPSEVTPLENPMGFYPAGWHYLVALTVQITDYPVTLCVNAINAIFIGLIYPSGCFFLLKFLFKNNTLLLCLGSVVALAFTAFPWGMLLKGPLYSNMASFSLLPAILGGSIAFIEIFLRDKVKIQLAVFAIASFVSLALTQTNGLFSVVVFLTCFLISFLFKKSSSSQRTFDRIKLPFFVALLAVVLWIISFKAPFMQGVVTYDWKNDLSLIDGLFTLLSLSLSASTPQLLLACTLPFGILYCLGKKQAWLLFPALFMACAYLECRCGTGLLKHLLAGFWYTDPYRLAANLAIFLVPIATAGIGLFVSLFNTVLVRASDALSLQIKPCSTVILIALVFSVVVYYPNYTFPRSDDKVITSFGTIQNRMEGIFTTDKEQVYSKQEQEFVEEVINIIPNGSLVINQPNDGSVYSYAVNDLNTYYHYIIRGKDVPSNETTDSVLIRTKLNEYASNSEVKKAVENIGAEYVMLLDYERAWSDAPKLPQSTQPSFWKGIDSITDETPGFELILAEDDMRLYKIVC